MGINSAIFITKKSVNWFLQGFLEKEGKRY